MSPIKFDVVLPENESLLENGRAYINEIPSRIPEDIRSIRDWLNKANHIKAEIDDEEILMFLRNRKFSLERTKERIDSYYTFRSLVPELLGTRSIDDQRVMSLVRNGLVIPLMGCDIYGNLVVLIRPGKIDPKIYQFEDALKASTMLMEILFRKSKHLQICGVTMIEDYTDFSMSHIGMMNFALMKKMAICWQEGFPIRPRAIHYLNTNPTFDTFFGIVKKLLKEKIRKRIIVHGPNFENLYKEVPKDILPVEYGGIGPKLEELQAMWSKVVEDNGEFFRQQMKYKVDESLRPGKPKTVEDIFGMVGSFRTLEID